MFLCILKAPFKHNMTRPGDPSNREPFQRSAGCCHLAVIFSRTWKAKLLMFRAEVIILHQITGFFHRGQKINLDSCLCAKTQPYFLHLPLRIVDILWLIISQPKSRASHCARASPSVPFAPSAKGLHLVKRVHLAEDCGSSFRHPPLQPHC